MFSMWNDSMWGRENITPFPKNRREMTVPVAAEMTKGRSEAVVKSIISTSIAKMMAAIGALKIAAIAPAEPQANNRIVFLADKLNERARLEPMADPVSTIGASSPTEPPNPTVMELATIEEYMLWLRNLPSCLLMDFKTMLTP